MNFVLQILFYFQKRIELPWCLNNMLTILIPDTPRIVSLAGQGRIPQHTYCSFVKKVCILFVKSISRCNLNQQLSTKTMHGMLILQPAWFTLIYGFACVILVQQVCLPSSFRTFWVRGEILPYCSVWTRWTFSYSRIVLNKQGKTIT